MIFTPIDYNNIQDKIENKLEKLLRNKGLKLDNDTMINSIMTSIGEEIDDSIYKRMNKL